MAAIFGDTKISENWDGYSELKIGMETFLYPEGTKKFVKITLSHTLFKI